MAAWAGVGVGGMHEGGQRVQTSTYNMNKLWEWNVHVTVGDNTGLCT